MYTDLFYLQKELVPLYAKLFPKVSADQFAKMKYLDFKGYSDFIISENFEGMLNKFNIS